MKHLMRHCQVCYLEYILQWPISFSFSFQNVHLESLSLKKKKKSSQNTRHHRFNSRPTWKFPGVPDNNGVIHAARREPDIVRWPGHVHHIWNQIWSELHMPFITRQNPRWHPRGRSISPPVWFLRMVTHLHCSTLANLLLDPNTVLGPMRLFKNRNNTLWSVCSACGRAVWLWHKS